MGTIHIADAEAARDFMGVLAQVKAGNEVVIESKATPVAVLRPPERQERTIEESIAILEARERERGYPAVMDEEFTADMREIIANRRPGRYMWDDE